MADHDGGGVANDGAVVAAHTGGPGSIKETVAGSAAVAVSLMEQPPLEEPGGGGVASRMAGWALAMVIPLSLSALWLVARAARATSV